ncbi:single-stranded DNA-binding protein [Anaerosolibacter sp.]|uniref:single-stranded DNA-binding protein n=1 Tax=Anaerosolibacter sp. TaxID=1872527 RepID=UPI0039EDEB11
MNQVILIGRLGKDPDLRFTAGSGKAVATFSLAVNRPFSKEKEADFFRIVVFGKTGENCANYLAKGRLVAVQGKLQNNNYETQSGEKRYTTEVIADQVEFLEYGEKKNASSNDYDGYQAIDDDSDDIPF